MPTLPISDGKGNLVPDADEQLSAVMAFPSEAEARKDALLNQGFDSFDLNSDGEEQKIKLGRRDIRRIAYLNPVVTEEHRIKGHHRGITAGRILLGIAILDRDLPGKASVNKVVNYLRSTRKKTRKQSRDPLTNKSEKSLYDIWSAFRPVAHLWVADELDTLLWTARDLMSEGKDLHSMEGWGDEIHRWIDSRASEFGDYIFRWLDSLPVGDDEDEMGLLRFLTEAEHFRLYGEARFSSGMKSQDRATLDPKTTWKVPADISLPDPILAVDLPPWPDLIDFCLSEYRS